MDFSEYMNDLESDFCIWLNKNLNDKNFFYY